jgi:hypothetical protein
MEDRELTVNINGNFYLKGFDALMEKEDLIDDFVFKFIPYLLFPTSESRTQPWFYFSVPISGGYAFISTSIKALIKMWRNHSSQKPKIGIVKVLVHKTEPVCYLPKEENSGPFYLITGSLYKRSKKTTRKTNELIKEKQPKGDLESRKNYFSLIKNFIGGAIGIFLFLGRSFCDLFKDEREW